jgi:hypothetical protein
MKFFGSRVFVQKYLFFLDPKNFIFHISENAENHDFWVLTLREYSAYKG